MYPVGMSDPNQMRTQDFVEGRRSNYFVVRSSGQPGHWGKKRGSISSTEENEPLALDKAGSTFGKVLIITK